MNRTELISFNTDEAGSAAGAITGYLVEHGYQMTNAQRAVLKGVVVKLASPFTGEKIAELFASLGDE